MHGSTSDRLPSQDWGDRKTAWKSPIYRDQGSLSQEKKIGEEISGRRNSTFLLVVPQGESERGARSSVQPSPVVSNGVTGPSRPEGAHFGHWLSRPVARTLLLSLFFCSVSGVQNNVISRHLYPHKGTLLLLMFTFAWPQQRAILQLVILSVAPWRPTLTPFPGY